MAREYFCAYHSMAGAIGKLSDAECGRLFKALLAYSRGDEPIKLQGREEILFEVFSEQIERDREKYQQKCEKNRQNVSKRYATTVDDRIPTSTKSYESYQDKDKEKYIPPKSPKGEDTRFESFWKAYPRHVAKANALKAWAKLKVDDALLGKILAAIEAQKQSQQWQKDGGAFIPHPATWLNAHRWEDEVHCAEPAWEPEAQKPRWADNWGDDG